MKAVIQRVKHGRVSVDGNTIAEINQGLVILLGIAPGDTDEFAALMAKKIASLRIFEDAEGKMNRSVLDVGGEAIVISQFTLYANTRKGRRPSFNGAAKPEVAEPMVEVFIDFLRQAGLLTKSGVFGAYMLVEIENDGPVTILIEFPPD